MTWVVVLEAGLVLALLYALLIGQSAAQADLEQRVLPTATAHARALATLTYSPAPTPWLCPYGSSSRPCPP